jgi:hypothetical protein
MLLRERYFFSSCINKCIRGEKRNAYRILMGKPEGKNHWEDEDVGGWTILKWILGR